MSDIRIGLEGIEEPAKSIGITLMEFYDNMKALENDPHRGGKQATCIIMAINDIESIYQKTHERP